MDGSWKADASAAMDRYAAGDDDVLPKLYDLLAPRLASFLLRQTGDDARAEALLELTFLQLHCARRHFAEGSSVVPLAFAIARRLLIDDFRKRGIATPVPRVDDELARMTEEREPSSPRTY
jgi:RNA polymerase sigma-70 factor (ECF subfamily)